MHVKIQSSVASTGDRRRLVSASAVARPDFRFTGHERVFALAWLSDRVPDQFIAEKLAEGVNAETGRRVALLTLKQEGAVHFGDAITSGSQVNGERNSAASAATQLPGWGWVDEQSRLAGFLPGLESPVAQYRVQLT